MHKHKSYFTKRRTLELGQQTYLAGILNLTPDSFSDGGEFVDLDRAIERFHQMVQQGAAIIDIGGESTRPGHQPVAIAEEIARVVPFIEKIRPHTGALISIDTSKSDVAEAALLAGADIVNDVWGAQRDPQMAEVIGRHNAACILMHNRSIEDEESGDVIEAICAFFDQSIQLVRAAGVREDAIMLDPGLGFGKTFEENWEIMRRLSELCALGYPLLLGASRKSMIAKLLNLTDPKARLSGSLATTALAVQAGVDFIRVHDVREHRECAQVMDHCLRYE
ncbi:MULTISPECIES: dihydropteroate synthase [unclassified Lentimonas]|uniref:dihydropteroate synthase n=1 Tax=unclassified Lentimonas TaxID=2630993 RepID=UPI00132A0A2C|nr:MULTISPECIES: dihydropteroate synthase [unclassified Lentimonas]CAA6677450.1 Dihydropteroate synthase (EC [Lentimonas sp. CC4]CAA6686420.1 Dihydropteroate synthase (EC [Lentimonas sp. CC6]CAA7074696.1 Dihydropteroate synthase (EC [Lentimonas sp. CC4]CAA7169320.1 Dihydropteroate synthase (EC [Lentimonas sp. CC21]CAA7180286.1 Dihydropteroate synthase (EC [Lentimonas sp. CC8]